MYERQYENYLPDLTMYGTLLDKRIPVVEFGSGTGRIVSYLLSNGYKVHGIEIQKEYRDFLLQRIQKSDHSSNFQFIEDIREIDVSCNLIYPFNVIFFLKQNRLIEELDKIKSHRFFNSVILESDNIHVVSSQNLESKEDILGEFVFREKSIKHHDRIEILSVITKAGKTIDKFNCNLYLHSAARLIELYEKAFRKVHFYGNFSLDEYTERSEKLIAVVDRI